MNNQSNKSVLITGGVRRLGLHIAYGFAERGALLGLNYFSASESEAEQAKTDCLQRGAADVMLLKGDITCEAEKVVSRFGGKVGQIDYVVNNAGVMPARKSLAELEISQFESTLSLNLTAPFAVAKAAVRYMISGGAIINLASLGGVQIWKERMDYNTSKAALIALTKALARELAPRQITVNCISPGAIKVDDETETRIGIAQERIPMGRYGSAGDIAAAVLYLAYHASYMTGQNLIVDGGRSLK